MVVLHLCADTLHSFVDILHFFFFFFLFFSFLCTSKLLASALSQIIILKKLTIISYVILYSVTTRYSLIIQFLIYSSPIQDFVFLLNNLPSPLLANLQGEQTVPQAQIIHRLPCPVQWSDHWRTGQEKQKGPFPTAASDVLILARDRFCKQNSTFLCGTRSLFSFRPVSERDRDEAQRWTNASSAFIITSDGINGVQTEHLSLVYWIY